ncbi:MAG: hypothetical protein COZ76_08720 [Flavobacteriales bacterium CG_4_8_14_3_um_filter_35_10]|nr:hypothetical protein [Zetaproteobacteria bacterium]NDK17439.1 hypothetical protein [Flavobacteriales bacterium]OIO11645.1 MAG: hypothetical protein AUJ53_04075 [Flavobacteriaceae bacterium CG1_02_35_72]PIR14270.1 MAG: hypothetical protein COV50_03720 [Flavobacteriales bacterium CG11_big_fil_rev_8_21_14_0_20_35_7]PIX06457.1 MAG: hypothetical protein COZ76_08720 [Flavobacteriales bacterium CG_4_8_14_3_um_filter_35_10]PJA05020.1 MAG: hypothetical protein COX71_08925 [Flavobacteriales bacterium
MKTQNTEIKLFSKSLSANLYQHLIVQLNKDLLLGGINLKFDSKIAPLDLVNQLQVAIENLVKNNYQTFNQFMYTLDVSEKKINDISETELSKLVLKLTELVLERLMQKVVLKQQFKNG